MRQDPKRPGFLYLAVKNGLFANGLPIDNFDGTLALDARHPAVLYAGTESQGVFRLESE